jgi:cytochrome c-type biogenesis protein
MQEQLKQNELKIGNRTFSQNQLLLGGLFVLLILFIIYGSFNQPTTDNIYNAPSSFLVLVLVAFAGGVLSFLSPCTLPILPAYFAFAFSSDKKTIAANTIAFMLGLASMFSLLGAGASSLGSLLYQQLNVLLLLGGGLVIIFGLMSLLGKGFTGSSTAQQTNRSTTPGGSFIFGLTFAVGWSSCVGPILGIMLTLAAATANVGSGMILLFIYALGLGLPLLIVSAFFGRASRDSLIWRIMRGRGTERTIATRWIAVAWAIALWIIALSLLREFTSVNLELWPIFDFSLFHLLQFNITGMRILLLLLFVAGAVIIDIVRTGGSANETLHLHSTSVISGILFLLMGMLLISGQLGVISEFLQTNDLAFALLDLEDKFLTWINR